MKNCLLFGLVVLASSLAVLSGCIELPPLPGGETAAANGRGQNCTIIYEEESYPAVACENLSVATQECSRKELLYTAGQVQEYDICMAGDGCAGKNLEECMDKCTRANKRCVLEITNNDNASGTWTVGATFIQGKAVYVKDPQTKRIEPGKKELFDFVQIYSIEPGKVTTTTCTVAVLYPAYAEECRTITRVTEVCGNVTETRMIEKEVCN